MQAGRYKCHLKSHLEAQRQPRAIMKILIRLSFFCKSLSFIKAHVYLTPNAFLRATHKNEMNSCSRSL